MKTKISHTTRKIQFEELIQDTHSLLSLLLPLDIKLIRKYNLETNSLFKVQVINPRLVIMPIAFNQAFSGILEFNFKNSLSVNEINKIHKLIVMKISSNSLPEIEISKPSFTSKNAKIISLDQYRKKPLNIDNLFSYQSHLNKKIKGPIFITGSSEEDQRKIALELHYYFNNQLFVSFEDIVESLKSPISLKELSGCTVLIEQYQNLDKKTKYFLLDYLTELKVGEEPLLLATSIKERSVLLNNALDRYLLKLMSQKLIFLDKTFTEIKNFGIENFISRSLVKPNSPFLKS